MQYLSTISVNIATTASPNPMLILYNNSYKTNANRSLCNKSFGIDKQTTKIWSSPCCSPFLDRKWTAAVSTDSMPNYKNKC